MKREIIFLLLLSGTLSQASGFGCARSLSYPIKKNHRHQAGLAMG